MVIKKCSKGSIPIVKRLLGENFQTPVKNGPQNGGRPLSWICYDVTVLHRRTHFRCANISRGVQNNHSYEFFDPYAIFMRLR